MPIRVDPKTQLGEVSLLRLSATYARHIESPDAPLGDKGRHLSHYSLGEEHEQVIVELVATTEHFSTGRLYELRPNIDDRDVGSWYRRNQAWLNLEQIDVEDMTLFPEWPKVYGFVEARNAIQHGLGRLTRRQLSVKYRDPILSAIAVSDIDLIGTRVTITERSIRNCFRICSDFILNLDRRARTP